MEDSQTMAWRAGAAQRQGVDAFLCCRKRARESTPQPTACCEAKCRFYSLGSIEGFLSMRSRVLRTSDQKTTSGHSTQKRYQLSRSGESSNE
eukprot:6182793-Pleurochrysis_carterae.AAC.1